MLVPITKTFWRGKVGTRNSGACNLIMPVTSMPVTSIYCALTIAIILLAVVIADVISESSANHASGCA